MSTRDLHGAYGANDMHVVHMGAKVVYIFVQLFLQWELVLILSQGPLKRRRAEVHSDTKNAAKGAGMTNTQMIQFSALMPSLNLGQICNTQNSAMAFGPEVGNYQRRYPAESQVFQSHSATLNIK